VLTRAIKVIRDGLLGLTYPEECRVCGGAVESWDDGVACAECWNNPALTTILTGIVCHKCGASLAPARPATGSPTQPTPPRFCGMCPSSAFSAARSCGIYSGALEASILSLKVAPHICPRLRSIICRTFSDHQRALWSDLVIPVPLHRLRESQRGFNQAELVAQLIAREFSLQLDDRSLKRIKPTERHRAGMDANDRAQSVRRAFAVVRPRVIEGASVLLVDDLHTTGSTISAASQTLIEAGARRVNVLTIARVGER
jgi:ComF family protein